MYINIIAIVFNILVCFGIPIASLIYFVKKKSGVKLYFIGCTVFFISQIIIRIPLINLIMDKSDSAKIFASLNPILYILIISFTAGLFEETGRFIGFKFLKKDKLEFKDAIAFGFGHGCIEAILFVGITNIINLLLYLFSQGLISGEMFLGFTKEAAINSFDGVSTYIILSSGIERIFAMTFHIIASIIVLYSIKTGKKLYLLLAMAIHTLFNFIPITVSNFMGIATGQVTFLIIIISLIFVAKYFRKKYDYLGVNENEKII